MIKVLILKSWNFPDLFNQTPGKRGIWDNVKFTYDQKSDYDYVLSLDSTKKSIKLFSFRENIWKINQEPPNEYFSKTHSPKKEFFRVFTSNPNLKGERFITSQPAIPWFIDKSYDFLSECPPPEKKYDISCINSLKSVFLGHKKRLELIKKIKKILKFELISTFDYYSRQNPNINIDEFKERQINLGYDKIVTNKWDGLSPFKFSLVIENFSGPNYWSEKLADCFLSFTIPIYYGCTNLDKFFPINSFIKIDINSSSSIDKINKLIKDNYWHRNLNSLKKARSLILEKYQFFPYFAQFIKKWEEKNKNTKRFKEYIIIPQEDNPVLRISQGLNAKIEQIKSIFKP